MKKIETSLTKVISDIEKFYDKKVHHFLTLNGLVLDEETIELQWIFSKYEDSEDITLFL